MKKKDLDIQDNMNLQEQISRMKSMMGVINEDKKKDISHIIKQVSKEFKKNNK